MTSEKKITIRDINDWAFGRADPEMTRRLDELRNDPDSAVSRYCNRMAGKIPNEGALSEPLPDSDPKPNPPVATFLDRLRSSLRRKKGLQGGDEAPGDFGRS